MASRFLSNININDEYTLPSADGSADQIIKTDGAGQLSFVDQSTINAGNAEHVVIYVKNTSGASISKGTPVYITGTVGATDTVEIAPANASDSTKMPAVGLLDDTLANNAFGYVITGGFMDNITTDPIDGVTPSSNDTVYVKSGGGLTLTKPTGTNFIQNVAKVGKVSGGNSGSLIVSSILRTNDVPTPLYVDHTNQRLGIGATSPNDKLTVENGNIRLNSTSSFPAQGLYAYWNNGSPNMGGISWHQNPGFIGSEWNHYKQTSPYTQSRIRLIGDPNGGMFVNLNNSDVFTILASNGNVGIGVTSPTSRLHVTQEQDNTFSTAIAWTASANDALNITNNDTTDTDNYTSLYMRADGSSGNFSSRIVAKNTTAGTGELHFQLRDSAHTANTETKLMIDSGGYVGIGTTSPQGLLHVSSGTSGDAVVIIEADTDNNNENDNPQLQFKQDAGGIVAKAGLIGDPGQIFTNSLGNGTYFGTDSNASVQFYTNGAAALTIREDGDVGIGTNSPVDKLDVRGTARITSPQANDWIVLAQNYATGAPSGFWDSNGNVHLYLRDSSSNTNVLIKSDSSSYFNGGNVGIGTSSPGAKLDVVSGDIRLGTNATYFRVRDTASAQPRVLGMNTSNNFYIGPIDSYAGGSMIYGASGNMQHHRFYIAGSEKVRITSGGNVGISTTNPSYKLDLQGDLRVDNGDLGGTSGDEVTHAKIHGQRHFLEFKEVRTANGTDWKDTTYKLQAGVDATDHQSIDFVADGSYQEHIDIRTGNQAFNTRFTYDGKVGIGTNSPTQKLHVYNGTAYVTPISYAANQSAYALRIGAYNSTNFDMGLQAKSTSGGSPYMSFKTSSADDTLTIWGGSVGIGGIGIPSYTLDVDGQIRGEQYLRLADTGGTNRFSIRAESTYGTIDNGSNTLNYNANNHLFLVGLSEKMRINSSGNVGIGITSPGAKLDIFNTGGNAGSLADCQTYSALTVKPYSSVDSKLTFSANGVSTQLIQATNNASTTGRQISLQPFGGDVGVGVILPSEKLDVNGVVKSSHGYKGYVSHFHNAGFFHNPRSGDGANPIWIPINSTATTSSDQYYNTWVPLYAGRVRKIILKHISGSTPTATVCTFRKKINGVLNSTTYAGTVTGGGAAGMKVTFDFGTTNFTFNAEDEVQIGVVTGVATQPGMGGVSCQIWYEYNIT